MRITLQDQLLQIAKRPSMRHLLPDLHDGIVGMRREGPGKKAQRNAKELTGTESGASDNLRTAGLQSETRPPSSAAGRWTGQPARLRAMLIADARMECHEHDALQYFALS